MDSLVSMVVIFLQIFRYLVPSIEMLHERQVHRNWFQQSSVDSQNNSFQDFRRVCSLDVVCALLEVSTTGGDSFQIPSDVTHIHMQIERGESKIPPAQWGHRPRRGPSSMQLNMSHCCGRYYKQLAKHRLVNDNSTCVSSSCPCC